MYLEKKKNHHVSYKTSVPECLLKLQYGSRIYAVSVALVCPTFPLLKKKKKGGLGLLS